VLFQVPSHEHTEGDREKAYNKERVKQESFKKKKKKTERKKERKK